MLPKILDNGFYDYYSTKRNIQMIHPNELRKGNWFNTFLNDKFKAEELRRDFVMGISETGFCNTAYSEIDPIQITPEILESAGFIDNGQLIFDKDGWLPSLRKRQSRYQVCNVPDCYVQYVHQLQNLYFALTGKELEIKSPE